MSDPTQQPSPANPAEPSPAATEGSKRPPIDLARLRAPRSQPAQAAPAHQATEAPPSQAAAEQTPAVPAESQAAPAPAQAVPSGKPPGALRREGEPRGKRPRRRREDDDERASHKPNLEAPEPVRPRIPVPNLRAPLPEDLQAEIDAALGDMSLEDIVAGRTSPAPASGRLENESRHRGQVIEVHGDNVFISLGGKNQGVASLRQFAQPPQPGEMLEVIVTGFNPEDNLHELSVPGGAIVAGNWSELAEGALVEARVTGANAGGLECQVNNLRGFIPASQVGLYRVENLGDYVGQKLVCVVTEADPRRANLVLSRRAVLEREKEEARKKTLAELQPGTMREGIVRKLHDFGAFVDLGGVDGLIHVSQLAWDRVNHPSEVVQEGQKVRVRVEKIDPQTGKISLSLKNPEEHPWVNVATRFPVGSTVKGTVSRIAGFGAFVKLAPGVEGLIHISELAHHKVYKVENIVQEGQEVEVKILSVEPEEQRIGLSLKALLSPPAKAERGAAAEEPETPTRPLAVPKRPGPLKGGVGKSSGGEQFGLRW
jgi:small subunit ribosomal protein S1